MANAQQSIAHLAFTGIPYIFYRRKLTTLDDVLSVLPYDWPAERRWNAYYAGRAYGVQPKKKKSTQSFFRTGRAISWS